MSRRRSWVIAAVLLVLGAAAGAGAVREHWLSCRGSMLDGSMLHGYEYGSDFSDACLQAMDNGFSFTGLDAKDPLRPEALLGVAFSVLLALAWSVVVCASAWTRVTKLVAAIPALLTVVAGLVAVSGASGDTLSSAYSGLLMLISLSGVIAFFVIAVREDLDPTVLWQVALVLLASTAVGFFPMMADYAFMTSFSDANWDTPPGTGYPTVATVALLAVALLATTIATRRRRTVTGESLVDSHP